MLDKIAFILLNTIDKDSMNSFYVIMNTYLKIIILLETNKLLVNFNFTCVTGT